MDFFPYTPWHHRPQPGVLKKVKEEWIPSKVSPYFTFCSGSLEMRYWEDHILTF